MIKYLEYFKCTISTQTIFRFEFFIEYIFQFINVAIKIFLWQAVVLNSTSKPAMSLSQVVTYFLIVFIVSQVTDIVLDIAQKIKLGTLSNHLIKPVNAIGLEFSRILAMKVLILIKFIPIFIIMAYVYRQHFIFPHFNFYSLVFLFMGLSIAFFVNLTIHFLAFWMTDVSAINYILVTFFGLFSGSLVPYEFIPDGLRKFLEILPFKFFVHVPVHALMGEITINQINNFLTLGGAYILFFILLNYVLFKQGLKKYIAVGG